MVSIMSSWMNLDDVEGGNTKCITKVGMVSP